MQSLQLVVGIILIVAGIGYIPVSRSTARHFGSITFATVFQFNLLPIMCGIGLIVFKSWLILLAFPVLWFTAAYNGSFYVHFLPLIYGGSVGVKIAGDMVENSKAWKLGGVALGALAMFILCTVVVGLVMSFSRD